MVKKRQSNKNKTQNEHVWVLRTLYEVNEHLQVPNLGLQLLHQLLLHSGRVNDLSDGGVHPLSQLLGGQVPDVLVQIHVQLLYQLVDDDLETETGWR